MTDDASRWATHSGKFHADDVLAYAMLRLCYGTNHVLVRTRDETVIKQADIVWDVGGEFDEDRQRFDHHQRGAPHRNDGTPYSAAGLVWQSYGEAVVKEVFGDDMPRRLVDSIATGFDDEVVHRVDEIDNGVSSPNDNLGFGDFIEDFNPVWDAKSGDNDAVLDAAFLAAAVIADGFIRRRLDSIRGRLAAMSWVADAATVSADPRILELGRKMPWKDAVFANRLPVLYAVFPVPDGNWMVDAMPPEPGSFEQRLPLPAAWAGLRGADLAGVTGVPDAVFVHPRRFIAAATSKDGAVVMARLAIGLGQGTEKGIAG